MNRYFANTAPNITEMEKSHRDLAREAAAKGIVLLENDGCLPLKKGLRLALFGDGARQTLLCGLGAASMNYRDGVSIEEGLKRAGFAITSERYLDQASLVQEQEYEDYYAWLREKSGGDLLQGVCVMYANPHVPSREKRISPEDISEGGDAAVYVISRCSGEGADRRNMPGDYQLLEDEKENLAFLDRHFGQVIVLLNTVGVIDTKFIRSLSHVRAILFIGLGGVEAGNGVADVLTGKVPAQGKLTATWAENYEDYPNALTYAGNDGNLDDERYTEGIYVGYRYFDSCGIAPAYPFGYGKTYGEFQISVSEIVQEDMDIVVKTVVKNIGSCYCGRETVQIYVSAPAGKPSKPYQSLAGYEKTSLLSPGQEEKLSVRLDPKSLASYDSDRAAWVLEQGDYLLRVGNSSRDTVPSGILRVEKEVVLEQCRNLFQPDCEMDEWRFDRKQDEREYRAAKVQGVLTLKSGAFRTLTHQYGESADSAADIAQDPKYGMAISGNVPAEKKGREEPQTVSFRDVQRGRISLDEFVCQLLPEELAKICVGNVPEEAGEISRASVMAAGTASRSENAGDDCISPVVPGASETTGALQTTRRIPKLNLLDGGSGPRLVPEFETDENGNLLTSGLFSIRGVERIAGKKPGQRQYEGSRIYYQYTTALPMALLLAQTWDRGLLGRCGEMIGRELAAFGADLWLAPSMNIHRNPLCGRNYEYYSEDPLVTGVCGCIMVHGVQLFRGVGATIKHLACNNQEANRGATNAHVSEQALREIYLRGYEKVIREEHPLSLMTSLNLINGVHAANSYDLLTAFAREECGFDGFVMTDWGSTVSDPAENNKYGCSTVEGCIRAGNDLIMPGTPGDIHGILDGVRTGTMPLEQLRRCAGNLLRGMLRLGRSV